MNPTAKNKAPVSEIGSYSPLSFEESKARHMYFKSKLEEAAYEEVKGNLIPAEAVRAYHEAVGGRINQGLQQLADRLAPRITHESDEMTVHSLILEEATALSSDIGDLFDDEESMRNIEDIKERSKPKKLLSRTTR